MLLLPDHLLFAVVAVLVPLRARFSLRRLDRAAPEQLPRVRLTAYRMILIYQWTLAAILLGWWLLAGRSGAALGLIPRLNGGAIGVAVGTAIVVVVLVVQGRHPPDERLRERIRRRIGRFERLMPRSRAELAWFQAVSFTAGVCEELLYRGFLIWYLSHLMPLVPAAFVAAAIFGIAHLYQGIGGILRTGALGGFLASVYLLTGSLYLSMLLHFLADVYSGQVVYAAFHQESEAPAAPVA